jgi:hypothetical protein
MKNIQDIIKLPEYRRHIFSTAFSRFACEPRDGPSLYFDSFRNAVIIYHLRESSVLKVKQDEVVVSELPAFIQSLTNVADELVNTLETIYSMYIKLAEKYEYSDGRSYDEIFIAYDVTGYADMWENVEFKTQFKADVAQAAKEIEPIQRLVQKLR